MTFLVEVYATYLKVHGGLNNEPVPESVNEALAETFKYSFREFKPASPWIKNSKPTMQVRTIYVYDKLRHTLLWGLLWHLKVALSKYGDVKVVDMGHLESGGKIRPTSYKKYEPISLLGGEPAPLLVRNKRELRGYQEEAVQAGLDSRFGHITLPTGAGKTEVFLNVIERDRPTYSLITVDGTRLVDQTYKSVLARFPKANVKRWDSKISTKEKNIACLFEENQMNIVVCSYQSFNTYKHSPVIDLFSHVLMDEIQKIPCENYAPVVDFTPYAYLRLGYTATAFRDDNASINVIGYCGPLLYSKSMVELVNDGYLAKPLIKEANLFTLEGFRWLIDRSMTNKVAVFHEHKAKGLERTRYILESLVPDMGEYQEKAIAFIENSYWVSRSDKTADKQLQAYAEASSGCAFVTPLMDVGVDIPNIDTIVLAQVRGMATGAIVTNIQRIGRALRVPPGVTNKMALVVINNEAFVSREDLNGEVQSYSIQPRRASKLYKTLIEDVRAYGGFDHGDRCLFSEEGELTYADKTNTP
jgi:superfamily II DNA or RNA helicase